MGKINIWANIVMSMLAVNQYPLEKVALLYDKLDANGLFDPQKLASIEHADLFQKLNDSGYNRADVVVGFLTERLMSLGSLAANLKKNEEILSSGTEQEVAALLSNVKGVGPVVLKNFLTLRGK